MHNIEAIKSARKEYYKNTQRKNHRLLTKSMLLMY